MGTRTLDEAPRGRAPTMATAARVRGPPMTSDLDRRSRRRWPSARAAAKTSMLAGLDLIR